MLCKLNINLPANIEYQLKTQDSANKGMFDCKFQNTVDSVANDDRKQLNESMQSPIKTF